MPDRGPAGAANVRLVLEVAGTGPLSAAEIEQLVIAALGRYDATADTVELGVQWCTPERSRDLNMRHRGVDEPTDVLSFPIDGTDPVPPGMPRQLGDLSICVAEVEAMLERGEGIDGETDLGAALRRCVVHGTLHLLGHHHETDEARDAMRVVEDELLR